MTLCDNCKKANMTCPVYPLETLKCVEYEPLFGPKPNIRKQRGYWVCETEAPNFSVGCGKTPYEAYLDWQYT